MSARDELARCREEIAAIDNEIVALLKKRLDLALRTGPLKRELGTPILDPGREASVIRSAVESARLLGLPDEDVREIFWHILKLSRSAQQEDA
ncbi:MAG TPA: chorismate mutase [Gemmatimonadaceae bacterium]